ncbi:hypothetical protein [Bacteroides sp. 214]|uniref:hypothetical protein n=1 Tax=Bacteroides sp. 214 TaxID=2302935 RepID=UPI0013D15F6C|nr:hypothetical protein [Bacteroides sp. 214]
MKKITFLLSLVLCFAFANAQTNLLTNGSFEDWASGTPTGWSVIGSPSKYTITAETSIVLDGTSSAKLDVPTTASGTISWSQSIASLTPGKTYTLSMSYYIESGDGTDARIWCNFKSGDTFFTDAELLATGLYPILRGPGNESSSGSSYFPDKKGAWETYTVDVTVPLNADGLDFQFRTYKGAVVYWDKFSFAEKTGTNVENSKVDSPTFYFAGNTLCVDNVADGTVVEIYSALGAKVLTSCVSGNTVDLNVSLTKGIYIIKAGNYTQKIMF